MRTSIDNPTTVRTIMPHLLQRIVNNYREKSSLDLLRKAIFFAISNLLPAHSPLDRLKSLYYFGNSTTQMGANFRVEGLPCNPQIGKNVVFYANGILAIGESARLTIGDNCLFSYGTLVACRESITIGANVQVGEYTSIRDTTHRYDRRDVPMREAGDISHPITIEDDVWIGRGCIILPGTYIESGAIVGANSVVKGRLQAGGIYGGTPCRLLKMRPIENENSDSPQS